VRYKVASSGEEHSAFTKNVGVGGAFILTPAAPPPGTRLTLTLELPSPAEPVEVGAEVRWIVAAHEGQPGSSREPGMGVKFDPLEVEQLLMLNGYFGSLTETVDVDDA
jgi:uncharacterized protein (TIGR02266 family)